MIAPCVGKGLGRRDILRETGLAVLVAWAERKPVSEAKSRPGRWVKM